MQACEFLWGDWGLLRNLHRAIIGSKQHGLLEVGIRKLFLLKFCFSLCLEFAARHSCKDSAEYKIVQVSFKRLGFQLAGRMSVLEDSGAIATKVTFRHEVPFLVQFMRAAFTTGCEGLCAKTVDLCREACERYYPYFLVPMRDLGEDGEDRASALSNFSRVSSDINSHMSKCSLLRYR